MWENKINPIYQEESEVDNRDDVDDNLPSHPWEANIERSLGNATATNTSTFQSTIANAAQVRHRTAEELQRRFGGLAIATSATGETHHSAEIASSPSLSPPHVEISIPSAESMRNENRHRTAAERQRRFAGVDTNSASSVVSNAPQSTAPEPNHQPNAVPPLPTTSSSSFGALKAMTDRGTDSWAETEMPCTTTLIDQFVQSALRRSGMNELDCQRCTELRENSSAGKFLIHLYTHEDPQVYAEINRILEMKDKQFYPIIKCMAIELMDMSASPTARPPKIIYRCLKNVAHNSTQTTYSFHEFTSTSAIKEEALKFADQKSTDNLLLEIHTNANTFGADVTSLSYFQNENEYLLLPLQDVEVIDRRVEGKFTILKCRTVKPVSGEFSPLISTFHKEFLKAVFMTRKEEDNLDDPCSRAFVYANVLPWLIIPAFILSIVEAIAIFTVAFCYFLFQFSIAMPLYLLLTQVPSCNCLTKAVIIKLTTYFASMHYVRQLSPPQYIYYQAQVRSQPRYYFLIWITMLYPFVAAVVLAARFLKLFPPVILPRIYFILFSSCIGIVYLMTELTKTPYCGKNIDDIKDCNSLCAALLAFVFQLALKLVGVAIYISIFISVIATTIAFIPLGAIVVLIEVKTNTRIVL